MPREKISVEFEIKKDLDRMLEYAAEKYNIKDKSKTLRCILEYVSSEADWDIIFKKIGKIFRIKKFKFSKKLDQKLKF